MRIAILTLPLNTNYGGILQCYALQTVLERMGHDVKVLDRPLYKRSYYLYWGLAIIKRLIKRFILRKKVSILYAPYQIRRNILRANTRRFIRKYIHIYVKKWNNNLANRFDAFVVGSDQVWRPAYATVDLFFLSFLKNTNVRRVSYAASFGLDNLSEYNELQIKKCASLLKKFDAVSVREDTAVKLCKDYCGVDAVQMLDPTLLLTAEDYMSIIRPNFLSSMDDGTMLVYILDKTDEKIALLNQIAKEKKLKPFWLDSPEDCDENNNIIMRAKMSVEQWLFFFFQADFVLTDSYHGCIFSIIFHKQFLALGNLDRGLCRFKSLFNQLSLNDRLILSKKSYEQLHSQISDIDFNAVDLLLNDKRKLAFDYLKDCLG